jgi:hypothetical protein
MRCYALRCYALLCAAMRCYALLCYALQPYTEGGSEEAARLEPAERFLLLLSGVPRVQQRLDTFLGKLTFASRLSDVAAQALMDSTA